MEEGLDAVLERHPTTREYDRKIDGDLEARLVHYAAVNLPKAIPDGRYGYWRRRWSNSITLTVFLT